MDVFVVTSGLILVEEMPEPSNMRLFGNSRIFMLHPSKITCYQYPVGFTIDSFIDSLLFTVMRGHTKEGKFNRDTLI